MRGSVQNVRSETGEADPHVFEIGGYASAAPPPVLAQQTVESAGTEASALPVHATPALPERAVDGAPLTTRQLLAQLRARLRIVEREIKARQSLEVERGQIKRLIAAAKTERNNVRAIRVAG